MTEARALRLAAALGLVAMGAAAGHVVVATLNGLFFLAGTMFGFIADPNPYPALFGIDLVTHAIGGALAGSAAWGAALLVTPTGIARDWYIWIPTSAASWSIVCLCTQPFENAWDAPAFVRENAAALPAAANLLVVIPILVALFQGGPRPDARDRL